MRMPPCVCFELTPVCAPTLSLYQKVSVNVTSLCVCGMDVGLSLCPRACVPSQSACNQELCGRKSEWVSLEMCFSLRGPCGSGALMKICVYQSVCTQVPVCVG